MKFSDIASSVNTGYSTSLCSMDDAPDWLDELEENVQGELGHYDRFTCALLARSIKHIGAHLEDGQPVRMPPLEPKDYEEDRLESWFNNRDRSDYMRKGEYGYYDRLDMAVEKDVKKAKQIGAQIEHREIFETTYNYLVENDIIEPPVPQTKRKHTDLANDEGQIDLEAVQQGKKDGAVQDALEQLQNTYSKGDFVHDRDPVELTNPEISSEKEQQALNLEIAFGLSLLSLAGQEQEDINFIQNLQVEESDGGRVLINDFADDNLPDASSVPESKPVIGEVTVLGKKDDLIKEYKKALRNGQNYAEKRGLEAEELPVYLTTTRELRIEEDKFENEFWNRAFNSHDSRLPNIIPASLERHAKLFRAFKELDDGSLENFERMLRGLSYAARQHDQSRSKYDNAQDWLNHSVSHIYERIVNGDAQSLRDLSVTITTEKGEEVDDWPLIVDGETIQPIVDELNKLDDLMGTGNEPFEVDPELSWDDAIDELYEQAHGFYDGVAGLLGQDSTERASFSSVKDTLKFPFLLGELRELEGEREEKVEGRFADIIEQFNDLTDIHGDFEPIRNASDYVDLSTKFKKSVKQGLPNSLLYSGNIDQDQHQEIMGRLGQKPDIVEMLDFIDICLEEAEIGNFQEIRSKQTQTT